MEIIKMGELPTFTNPKGITVRKLLDKDGLVLMNLLFKPGEVLEKHTTPQNVVFYVVKGAGTVMIGDEESQVQEDELVYSPKGIPHGLKAAGDQEFHVLVWKLPTA
ncbi:cupin domain-containing protein [Desulfallas thermosapovorans]|uniref:Mannose-6-phosphate isomerase-like protein (Cupin superfamily) n=1 Tax=Desulfallas thermosapovorans DSM 6562 TaxID=1121431 RepID=A0A5S4ZMW3_9FIRM|nr:cupin domain-containing protein [Desulfallas thermosapovorans]TYO93276.1 mannose-6-phosphate isomerase-like protein (cupin superfamily) [Desulfallas thermosapovorans DSM 6562]